GRPDHLRRHAVPPRYRLARPEALIAIAALTMTGTPTPSAVKAYLLDLQSRIVQALEAADGLPFLQDAWERPEGGGGLSRLIEEGHVLERGGVNFSHVMGAKLPPSAAAARPDLGGQPWEAMGVSLVLHPRNPYAP